jgi:hypothetical protein
MSLALLEVSDSQCSHFVTPQPTSKQEGKQRSVSFPLEVRNVRSLPECGSLFGCQPVAEPDAQFLYPLHASDSGRQVGAEKAAVRSLVRQAANRTKPEIDCSRRQMSRLQMHSVPDDNGFAER